MVGADNKVAIRNVNLGLTTREEAVVLSGVNVGDKIVVQGIQKVTDGCSVMPLPPSSAPAPTGSPAPSPAEVKGETKKIPAANS